MTMGYQVLIRNAKLDLIPAALDAGGGSAKFRIYDGARPATGAALSGQVLGAELLFAGTSAGSAASGTLTFNAIADDVHFFHKRLVRPIRRLCFGVGDQNRSLEFSQPVSFT